MLAIGVDMGGTKIEAALVDENGNVLKKERFPTQAAEGPDKILENLNNAINSVKTEEIIGIGIGAPGFSWSKESTPNVPGLGISFEKFLEQNPDTIIENDANCFALAEYMFGAGKGTTNMLGLIWGTGIGGGIILDGKLVRGTNDGAGEFGHTTIESSEEGYRAGGPGTWEYFCSGPNIIRRYKELGGTQEDPNPNTIFESDEEVAKKVKEETIKFMGIGLGNLVNVLNPEVIVVGGGVSNTNVYDELNESMRENCLELSGKNCRVVKNSMGDSSGVLGAAALVFKKF